MSTVGGRRVGVVVAEKPSNTYLETTCNSMTLVVTVLVFFSSTSCLRSDGVQVEASKR